jgi:hypothetical protein
MLMAGVLNSEVEKYCPASYRGAPPGSKSGKQFSTIPRKFRAFAAMQCTVSHENRETFAGSIGTFRKKG